MCRSFTVILEAVYTFARRFTCCLIHGFMFFMLFTVMLDAVYMFSMCFTCFLVHVCMLLTLFTAIQEAVYRPCVLFTVVLGSLHPIFCILYVFYMLFDCFTPPPKEVLHRYLHVFSKGGEGGVGAHTKPVKYLQRPWGWGVGGMYFTCKSFRNHKNFE